MLSIRDIVLNMYAQKEIRKKVKEFLLDFPMRTRRFYLLPKIHKGKFPPPGRPIISGNGCPTERISQFVDFFMKELSPKGPSFLKDTTDFLHSLHAIGKTPPGTLLATLDVTSLYTNIPNDEGIRAAELAMEEHRPFGKEPFNNSIIDLLRLVLTCNNFTFNGQDYLQVGGTAMGTKTAPNYAVNFMNFMDRMVNHFATIRGEQMKYPVGHHFSRRNHHLGLEDVRLYVLEFCQTPPTDEFKQAREVVERKWQFRLLSNYPSGMNRDDALPTG